MINDNLKKINQILEIVKIMQQERSGAFLVLLSLDETNFYLFIYLFSIAHLFVYLFLLFIYLFQ